MVKKVQATRATPQRLSTETFFAHHSSLLHLYHSFVHESTGVHWHEFYEAHFIVAGEGVHLLNEHEHPLRAGTFFLLTPTDFHAVIPQPGQPLELFNVIFKEELFSPTFLQLLFATPGNLIMQADEKVAQDLEREFRRLWYEDEQQFPGCQEVMHATLTRLLIDLRRGCSLPPVCSSPARENALQTSIRPALIYLHHHFREPLALAEVACQAGLSPHYFSECFHKATGLTFQAYLQDVRLRFARSLLAASPLPVTTICSSAGFNSLGHFERLFKQHFAISPRAYQQRCIREKHSSTQREPNGVASENRSRSSQHAPLLIDD